MIFGVGFYSFTIGSLSSVLSNIDTRESILSNKLIALNEFCNETGIDMKLKGKMRSAVKYNSFKLGISWTDKLNLFNELPRSVRYNAAL
jgi:hypothetical protein|mmetsp:Transcript_3863/g.516  ORF Transcript_3863/g.516 Transcript_3863/m.516 type:complete len:89 (+) Transcript_3863:167-433(+)